MSIPTRRQLLRGLAAASLSASLPRLALADAGTDARLVLVILRGAVDGLALAPPYGEGRYAALRGALALPGPDVDDGLLRIDGLFGLHPALQTTHALLRAGEALVVHAVASPYRARSHFDGQDVLETGAARVGARRDGWLNRALAGLRGRWRDPAAIALDRTTPLVLRGDAATASWAPSRLPGTDQDTLARLAALYDHDAFFAERLERALRAREIAADMPGMSRPGRRAGATAFADTMRQAARFLTAPDGPRIAVAELGGWDTHANQGAQVGGLANRFAALDVGLGALRDGLGAAWSRTVALAVTEFGRTVGVNGTRGTDHGTATAALVLGGAVAGGRVLTDWPGLAVSDLYEGRDLYPTGDLRSLFKGVLEAHLGVPEALLEERVFPDSGRAGAWTGIVHASG